MRRRAITTTRLDRTLAAFADPTRRRLLDRVGRKAVRVSDVGAGLPMTRPAVSKHLRVLREAGLIEPVPQGREVVYRLARHDAALAEVRRYVARLSGTWDRALAAFKAFAEQEEDA